MSYMLVDVLDKITKEIMCLVEESIL